VRLSAVGRMMSSIHAMLSAATCCHEVTNKTRWHIFCGVGYFNDYSVRADDVATPSQIICEGTNHIQAHRDLAPIFGEGKPDVQAQEPFRRTRRSIEDGSTRRHWCLIFTRMPLALSVAGVLIAAGQQAQSRLVPAPCTTHRDMLARAPAASPRPLRFHQLRHFGLLRHNFASRR